MRTLQTLFAIAASMLANITSLQAATIELNPEWGKHTIFGATVFPEKLITKEPLSSSKLSNSEGLTIQPYHNHIHLSGRIEDGDTNKIKAALDKIYATGNSHTTLLSFNSSGGEFYEGINISKFASINKITTYVAKKHQCLSACAIAFLGGLDWHREFSELKRFVHIEATLGFHSPYEDTIFLENLIEKYIEKFGYSTKSILGLNKYILAIRQQALTELVKHTQNWSVTEGLLSELMNRGPKDFIIINNAALALREKISIVDDKNLRVPRIDEGIAERSCDFAVAHAFNQSDIHYNYPDASDGTVTHDVNAYRFRGKMLSYGTFECKVFVLRGELHVQIENCTSLGTCRGNGRIMYSNTITFPMTYGIGEWKTIKK